MAATARLQANDDRLAALLAAAGGGSARAFEELYEISARPLAAVLRRSHRNAADVEDLLQEVYVKIWHAAPTYRADASPALIWMALIARNSAFSDLRYRRTRSAVTVAMPDTDEPPDTASDAPGCEVQVDNGRRDAALHSAISRLPGEHRQCVMLSFFQDRSHSEVATHLHRPLGTVKSWLRRSVAMLQADAVLGSA